MPMPSDPIGIGNDAAQLIGGGAFAVGAREYLRPASVWKQRILASLLCLSGAYLFGTFVAKALRPLVDVPPTVAGAIAGLACIGVAEGVIATAEKLDISLWSPWKKMP